jgi:quercetin dioxygenase-like cupin family protein
MQKAEKTKAREIVSYQDNGIVSSRILENKNGGVTIFAFAKGQRLSEHSAPFDATVMVLEGTGEIIIGGTAHHLSEGDVIIMPANVPHAVNAPDNFKMMLIMVKE